MPKPKLSIRKLLEAAGAKGQKVLKRITESDPTAMGIASPGVLDFVPPDMTETAEVEQSPEDLMEDARDAQVMAVINDDTKDTPAKLAAIEAILNAHNDIQSAVTTGTTETPADSGGDNTAMEATRKALADMQAKLAKMEAKQTAVKRLTEAHVEPTEERIEAVAAVTDATLQNKLIESWKVQPQQQLGERPATSRRIQESTDLGDYENEKKVLESMLKPKRS